MTTATIFDFKKGGDISSWLVVDDVVMGGRSDGQFFLNEKGNAVFKGTVSLENNGGFSSVRYRFPTKDVSKYNKIIVKLKGDGKIYQFRVKTSSYDYHSYITYIKTTNEWQTVTINLSDLYPSFRGRKLKMENFPGKELQEIAFLIGNKKAESFLLELDEIVLK
ncbi:MAG: CIA30 family protein [Flavobacteriaceae bacterium]